MANVSPYVEGGRPLQVPVGPVLEKPFTLPPNSNIKMSTRGWQNWVTKQLEDLYNANFANRDRALLSTLTQLDQPGFRNVLEAQAISPAVQDFYRGRQQRQLGLVRGGLEQSGAAELSQTGLEKAYGNAITSAILEAQDKEAARKQGLLETLQNLTQQDIGTIGTLGSGYGQLLGAEDAASLLRLQDIFGFAKGSAEILGTVLGGFAGAAGAGGATGFGGAASKVGSSYGLSGQSGGAVGGAILGRQGAGAAWGGNATPSYSPGTDYNTPLLPSGETTLPGGRGTFTNRGTQPSLLRSLDEYQQLLRLGGSIR